MTNPNASALGSIKTPKKAAASRRNGLKNIKNAGRKPAQFGTCPNCLRRISLLKAGGFRAHKFNGAWCDEKGNENEI